VAADISSVHLALAQQALDRFERTNVNLVHLDFVLVLSRRYLSLMSSSRSWCFNTTRPPLIAATLKTVLTRLRPGGDRVLSGSDLSDKISLSESTST